MISREDDRGSKSKASRSSVVISLERSTGPNGATGKDWYRYVISGPGSPITGYRRGKKRDVLAYLKECTSQLDERLVAGKAPRAATGRKPNQTQAPN